jgi:pilus retraction protein PilT
MVGLVMRHVKTRIPSFKELDLPPILEKLSMAKSGIVMVCGSTGVGKSTTLAAMIEYINTHARSNVITIEDPIEYLHRDDKSVISQREVGIDTISFASALRLVMRQDPDVVMVGEIRDRETVKAALTASEVGRLVLTTLHSPTASHVISRLLDFFPMGEREQIRFQVAANLNAAICQRLLQRADAGGMVPAVEIMLGTPTIKKLIRNGKVEKLADAIQEGREEGMQTFNQHLVELVVKSKVAEREALSKATNPEALKMNLQGIFLDESRKIIGSD